MLRIPKKRQEPSVRKTNLICQAMNELATFLFKKKTHFIGSHLHAVIPEHGNFTSTYITIRALL